MCRGRRIGISIRRLYPAGSRKWVTSPLTSCYAAGVRPACRTDLEARRARGETRTRTLLLASVATYSIGQRVPAPDRSAAREQPVAPSTLLPADQTERPRRCERTHGLGVRDRMRRSGQVGAAHLSVRPPSREQPVHVVHEDPADSLPHGKGNQLLHSRDTRRRIACSAGAARRAPRDERAPTRV